MVLFVRFDCIMVHWYMYKRITLRRYLIVLRGITRGNMCLLQEDFSWTEVYNQGIMFYKCGWGGNKVPKIWKYKSVYSLSFI